jgi:hypothetical protein
MQAHLRIEPRSGDSGSTTCCRRFAARRAGGAPSHGSRRGLQADIASRLKPGTNVNREAMAACSCGCQPADASPSTEKAAKRRRRFHNLLPPLRGSPRRWAPSHGSRRGLQAAIASRLKPGTNVNREAMATCSCGCQPADASPSTDIAAKRRQRFHDLLPPLRGSPRRWGTFPRLTPSATGCHRFAIKTGNKRESRSDGSM